MNVLSEYVKETAFGERFCCYHACMNVMRVIPFLMVALMLSLPAQAADDALPPPQIANLPAETASQPGTVEKSPNIRNQLQAPSDNTAADIRSYQRKDGAIITEYGEHGRVFKIKVQPAGGMPAYYLYPDANGHFADNLLGGVKEITPPSWILKKF